MKNNLLKTIIGCLYIVVILTCYISVDAIENNQTVGEVNSFIDGIVDYKLKETKASSIQQWIDGELTENVGISSEWYIIALSQSGKYDFGHYEEALLEYLSNNKVYSASSRLKYALTLSAIGSTDEYIYITLNDSIGQQGIMSYILGLHLLNNGYFSNNHTISSIKEKLLSMQLNDGGWAITGTNSDVDVTAMTIQALAPYYDREIMVKESIDKALQLLSNRQLSSGAYSSYGITNPESTAQVLVALSAVGIDGENDTRFIKDGNSIFDGMKTFKLSDGSFCHKQDGGYNETATTQVFYSAISYIRMKDGKTAFYILDNANTQDLKELDESEIDSSSNTPLEENTSTEEQTTTSSNEEDSSQTTSGQTTKDEIANQTTTFQKADNTSDSSENLKEETINKETENNKQEQSIQNKPSEEENTVETEKKEGNYKIWVCLATLAVAGCVMLLMIIRKNRNIKNYIMLCIITILVIFFIIMTNIQTPEEYYDSTNDKKESVIGNVTLTIRCDTIAGKTDKNYIPENGIIMDVSSFEIEEGDTVYDVLMEAASKYKIHIETTGTSNGIYVEGINFIYELEFGELSGWMYFVDGEAPNVGCAEYKLTGDEVIEWLYTCELGNDLNK